MRQEMSIKLCVCLCVGGGAEEHVGMWPLGKPGKRWKDNIKVDLTELNREE